MSNFVEALKEKVEALEDELQEYEDAVSRIQSKIEVLNELIEEEGGKTNPSKKKSGRPKGSRNRKTSSSKKSSSSAKSKKTKEQIEAEKALYKEAVNTLPGGKGSSEEEQQKAIARFNPAPRIDPGSGGVKAGDKESVLGNADSPSSKSHVRISIDDEGDQ